MLAPRPTIIDLAIAPVTDAASHADAIADLDASERARLGRLRHPADRLRFVAGRALLRELVALRTGVAPATVRLGVDGRGRPRLDAPAAVGGLDVAIAHAGGAVVVALASSGRVGVDVEPVAGLRDLESIALTPDERLALASLPADRRADRVLAAWTAKEAYAKLTGHGLCLDFTRLPVERIAARPRTALRTVVVPVGGSPYRVALAAWMADPAAGIEIRLPAVETALLPVAA